MQEAYALVLAALLLSAGRIGDRVGRRRVLLVGIGIFVTASVLVALSPTPRPADHRRLLQGLGGAAIFPATLSPINATFVLPPIKASMSSVEIH